MKILIPIENDTEMGTYIAPGLHETELVCIFDCSDQSIKTEPISNITAKPGNLSLALKQMNIFTIITGNISMMALGLFTESGVKVYKAEGNNLKENIQLFLKDKLDKYTMATIYNQMKCSSSCASCHTSCS